MINHKLERVLDAIVEGTIKQQYIWKDYKNFQSRINTCIDSTENIDSINYEGALFFEKDNQIILLSGDETSNKPDAFALFIIEKDSNKVSKYLIDYPNYIRLTNHIWRVQIEKDKMLDDFLK